MKILLIFWLSTIAIFLLAKIYVKIFLHHRFFNKYLFLGILIAPYWVLGMAHYLLSIYLEEKHILARIRKWVQRYMSEITSE